MAEELKIVIDADVQKAITNFKKFEDSLKRFSTGSVKQLEAAAAGLRNQLESLSASALRSDFGKKLSSSLQTVEARLKAVKQEAGLMGQETIDVFEHMNRQFKEFAAIGPNLAIGFALGAASGAIEDFLKEIFKGKSGLTDFAQATKEAFQKSGEESFRLEGLVSIARDVTASTKERKAAIDELQKTYPAYLQNISLENINSAATTKAIDDLTEATFNKALADVFAAKGAAKQLEIFEKIQKIKFLAGKVGEHPEGGASRELPLAALKLENQRLDKLIEERDVLKQEFKDTQESLFDVFRKPPPKPEGLQKGIDDILSRARLFVKEFGDVFVLPDLNETFFRGVKELLPEAEKLLQNVKTGNLIIKVPKVEFQLQPDGITPLTKEQLDELTKGFFNDLQGVPVDIVFDPTLSVDQIKLRDQQAKLRELFKNTFGKIGQVAFGKINFDNLKQGIDDASKKFNDMKLIADTLTQSVGEGLSNAFNNVFDAILEGKNVFKALGESVKALVVETIKAIAKMLILKTVTRLLGGGVPIPIPGISGGGRANFGLGGAVGGRSFQNTLNVVVTGSISGSTINLAGQRAANSTQRGG